MTRRFQTVAVLMGGWSAERAVSLVSGKAVADALEKSGYTVTRIDVQRDLPALLAALTPRPDAVFNALHGRGGEDGCIQGVLEMMEIPYTHSGVLASSIAMDKPAAKALLATIGVPSPQGVLVERDDLDGISLPFAAPYVIKPADEGSSVGVHIVQPGDNRNFAHEFAPGSRLLVERYIPGRELTVGVQGFSGEEARAMAVTEIRTHQGFYDYENKYTDGKADHILPAPIPHEITACVKQLAVTAHETLACSGVTRSDFRWDDSKPGTSGLYFLEINTQPGMTGLSLVPEQAAHIGIGFPELVSWLVEGAQCHS
jgi:D-alanine-D-alanine ligase